VDQLAASCGSQWRLAWRNGMCSLALEQFGRRCGNVVMGNVGEMSRPSAVKGFRQPNSAESSRHDPSNSRVAVYTGRSGLHRPNLRPRPSKAAQQLLCAARKKKICENSVFRRSLQGKKSVDSAERRFAGWRRLCVAEILSLAAKRAMVRGSARSFDFRAPVPDGWASKAMMMMAVPANSSRRARQAGVLTQQKAAARGRLDYPAAPPSMNAK